VVRETVAGIDRSGEFGPAEVSALPWSQVYTTEAWLEARRTHSGHLSLEPQRRERLLEAVGDAIEALGGSFEVQYETVLVSAVRQARTLA
jgi:hypothetical protein